MTSASLSVSMLPQLPACLSVCLSVCLCSSLVQSGLFVCARTRSVTSIIAIASVAELCSSCCAGTPQSSQGRFDQTPAYAQPALQIPPAAPQRQTKAAVPASALAGLQKLQLHTPAADRTKASGTLAVSTETRGSKGAAEQAGRPDQKDLKSLIQREFARLMATKTYTPNEAAVLAVKNVSQQQ